MNETHYWIAVARLQKMAPGEFKERPDLQGVKLTLDVGAPGIDQFDDWLRSLKGRGLE